MLYNIEKKQIKTDLTCKGCPYYNTTALKCDGLNKCCYEYDPLTKTCFDGVTKLPLKTNG